MGVSATYVSAISFTVATDLTAVFHSGRRVRAYCGVDGYKYGTILSSSYSDPDTTVLLTAASDDLTANLASVDVGVVGAAANSAMPEHGHDINLIINGCMRIAQRGTSFVAGANDDDTYVLDRWNLISDGNDIVDVTQQSSGGVDGNSKYIRLDVETVSKKFGIVQIVEAQNLYGVIGKEVSVSFDLKVSNATKLSDIRAAILSWDSTADTVTSDVVSAWAAEGSNPTWATNWTAENTPANLSVTTSWARYTINGINVDTASAANIALVIWQNNVATNDTLAVTLDITNVKVAPSPFASKMITRHMADELALCQRYYETANAAQGVAQCYNASYIQCPHITFVAPKRTASCTLSTSNVSWLPGSGGGWGTIGAVYSTNRDAQRFSQIYNTSGGTPGYGGKIQFDWDAKNEL
jgi:hypothetical protein